MEQAFGKSYAASVAADLVLGPLGGRTARAALEDGVPPRDVWNAVCDVLGLDDATRWRHRDAPKARRRG